MFKVHHIIGILLLFFCATAANAQVGDSLVIHFKNGKTVILALKDIQKITFDSLTAGVAEKKSSELLSVSPSYPNPTTNKITIDFTIENSGNVSIAIFDNKGELIRSLNLPNAQAGKNKIEWDGLDSYGTHVSSGSYFYEVRFKDELQIKQMLMVK
jgi:flagellar hook assembly protein FlgD